MSEVKYIIENKGISLSDIWANSSMLKNTNMRSIVPTAGLTKMGKVDNEDIKPHQYRQKLESIGYSCRMLTEVPAIFPLTGSDVPKYIPQQMALKAIELQQLFQFLDGSRLQKAANYTSSNKIVNADKRVFSFIRSAITTDAVKDSTNHNLINLEADLVTVANDNYLGHASKMGQLNRLKKAKESFDYSVRNQRLPMCTTNSAMTIFADIRKYFPLYDAGWRMPFTTEEITMSKDKAYVEKVAIPKINLKAEAGPPSRSLVKRKQLLISDVYGAFQLLRAHEFMASSWSSFCHLKAKGEVYKRSDAKEKVRNIFVYNSAASMMPLTLVSLVSNSIEQSLVGNSSLMKFKISEGYGMRLLTHILKTKEGLLVYSDNVFHFRLDGNVIRWMSMDGVRMESAHSSPNEMRLLMTILMMKTMGVDPTTNDGKRISKEIADYLMRHAPTMYINSPAIFENVVFQNPGLGSGSPLTMLVNHFLSSKAASLLEGSKVDSLSVDQINALISSTGVQLTVELRSQLPLPHLWGNGSPDFGPGLIIPADLLGYDFGCVINPHTSLPELVLVLIRKRLLKSLMFDKTELNPELRADTHLELIKMMKTASLYMAGGYYYQDTEELLRRMYQESLERLKHSKTGKFDWDQDEVEQAITETISADDGDIADEILSVIRSAQPLDKQRAILFAVAKPTNKRGDSSLVDRIEAPTPRTSQKRKFDSQSNAETSAEGEGKKLKLSYLDIDVLNNLI